MYNSVFFSIIAKLYINHHYLIPEHFPYPPSESKLLTISNFYIWKGLLITILLLFKG